MSHLRLVATGAAFVAILSFAHNVPAHEVRPAYLHIKEIAPDYYEALWKEPRQGNFAYSLAPTISNGLLAAPPDDVYSTNSYTIRRWSNRYQPTASYDGATVGIDGLDRMLTDALVEIDFIDGQHVQQLLKPRFPQFTIALRKKAWPTLPAYFKLGVEHILRGIDHLAFVIGMLLLSRSLPLVLKMITAFTLAHSLTLAASATGYVVPKTQPIEVLVALTLLFVAVELSRSSPAYSSITTKQPWLIAFSFGLLHGFAFAGALADIGLPRQHTIAALMLFNFGVEFGQLVFVCSCLALSILARLARLPMTAGSARLATTYGIGIGSCYWLLERLSRLV